MLYTFRADGTIRNEAQQVVLEIQTKRGKPWKEKKLNKIIQKHISLTPFTNDIGLFSILAEHKKSVKNQKYKLYEFDEDGKLKKITKWFKIETSKEDWLNKNTGSNSDSPVELVIIEEIANQAHGFFTFRFSEKVSGFTADDVQITGGTKGSFYNYNYNGGDRSKYEMWIERDNSQPEGTLTISIPENAAQSESGGPNNGVIYSAEYDYKSPTYRWSDDFSGQYTIAATSFTINLKFSEFIKDFQREFLDIKGGKIGGITSISENLEYKIEIIPDPNKEDASLSLSLDRSNISDKAGNTLQLAEGDRDGVYRRWYDTKQPTATVNQSVGSHQWTHLYNNDKTVRVNINFSEYVKDFKKEDIDVNGGQIWDYTAYSDNVSFYLTANENETGIIEVFVKDDSYTDLVGHIGSGSNLWTIPYDREDPFITNESFSVDQVTGIITYQYDFSEPVDGLLPEHIEVYEKTNNHHTQPQWQEISSELIQSDNRMIYLINFKPTEASGSFSTDVQLPLKDDLGNSLTVTSDYNYGINYSI